MKRSHDIDNLKIPEPCEEPWQKMRGNDLNRFCKSCEKKVYNLSEMTRRKANHLLRRTGGDVCVRFARTTDGEVVTKDNKLYQITRSASFAAGIIAATASLSGSVYTQGEPVKISVLEKKDRETPESKTAKNKYELPEGETSQISFSVNDPNGSAIPSAVVRLTHKESGYELSGQTGPDGRISFGMFPRGKIIVDVEAPNFNSYRRTKTISLPMEPTIDVALDVGAIVGVIVIDNLEYPVFDAIAENRIEDVEQALRSGFDVDASGEDKRTALHISVDHLRVEITRLLLKRRAKVNAKTEDKETALVILADWFGEDDEDAIKILRMLIEAGADLDAQDDNGETALMYAAYYDDPEAVEILLAAGAKTDIKDEDDETAYDKIEDQRIRDLFHRYGVFK